MTLTEQATAPRPPREVRVLTAGISKNAHSQSGKKTQTGRRTKQMTSNQPPEHFTDAPLCTVNWEGEEVSQGFVEVTFLIPETGRSWGGKTVADLTIKDKTDDQ